MTGLRRVTILVCGDVMRGDDAVADAMVRALPTATRRLVEVREVGGLMPDDLLAAAPPVIVVDAVHGPPAGTIVDRPLNELSELFDSGVTPGSSHALPLPMVLQVVERLSGSLPEGRFIGVAGEGFGIGAPLTANVAGAVERGAAHLNHWIRVLVHERRAAACA
jgi:hydrogenase maturation protease